MGQTIIILVLILPTTVSIFLNGLSAGYQIQLLDTNGNLLDKSQNNGFIWESPQ